MDLVEKIKNLNWREALEHAGSPWALAYFPSATALRMGLDEYGIKDSFTTVDHFAAGTLIAAFCYDLARRGKNGLAAAVAGIAAFNVAWEIMEAVGGFSEGLQTLDTYADVFAVSVGAAWALGCEYLRHKV